MDNNHKNVIAAGIFLIVFIITFLLSEDMLKSLVSGILVAIITEIIISKRKDTKENPHLRATVETKTKSENSENNQKIINWRAVILGLVVSGILVMILLFSPLLNGVTELSEEASIQFTLLLMGSVFLGGAVTGYISGSGKGGVVNSAIFAVILGLLAMLLDPLMLIFVVPGPIGGIVGGAVGKVLKNNQLMMN